MRFFHSGQDFLDMEGVTGSSPVASTTNFHNENNLLYPANFPNFSNIHLHGLAKFSPGTFTIFGTNSVQDLFSEDLASSSSITQKIKTSIPMGMGNLGGDLGQKIY